MNLSFFQSRCQLDNLSLSLILYIIYYPQHLKYAEIDVPAGESDARPAQHIKTTIRSDDWRLSITLSSVVAIHLYVYPLNSSSPTFNTTTNSLLLLFVTFLLLGTSTEQHPTDKPIVSIWATFLGVSSAILAAIQYMPQIERTWRAKLVGALSIPMMCMQSPGAIAMVLSIALRYMSFFFIGSSR